MREKGLSQAALAGAVGASPGAIQQILNGSTKRSTLLIPIADALEVSQLWLRGLSVDRNHGFGPSSRTGGMLLLGDLTTRRQPDVVDPIDPKSPSTKMVFLDHRLVPAFKDAPDARFSLIQKIGDQMAPTIGPEDIILMQLGIFEVDTQDQIWVLGYGGFNMVRRIRKLPDEAFHIYGDNPTVPPFQCTAAELHLYGPVIWSSRHVSPIRRVSNT